MSLKWGNPKFTLITAILTLIVPVALFACSNQQKTGVVSVSVTGSSTAAPLVARRNLSEDEARGGHTLSRHVGKSDEELRARLDRERITAASTYTDALTAEQTVGTALHREIDRVQSWTQRSGRRPNLAIDYRGDSAHPVGRTMHRGESTSQPCANAVVVLKSNGSNGYFVLTSYPECR